MSTAQGFMTILIVIAGTMLTRFLPFLIFPADRQPPAFIRFLGRILPSAVIGLLVIYSLKDSVHSGFYCLPEIIAVLCIFLLHKWKKNTLLSIGAGTLIYMLLVQNCFV